MSKGVKYVFCLCFVCCVIASVTALPKADFSRFENSDTNEILTEQNVAVTAQSIFAEALRQEGINFTKITVDANKLNDGSIVISRVTVYSSEEPTKIFKAISSDGYEVEVINE